MLSDKRFKYCPRPVYRLALLIGVQAKTKQSDSDLIPPSRDNLNGLTIHNEINEKEHEQIPDSKCQ